MHCVIGCGAEKNYGKQQLAVCELFLPTIKNEISVFSGSFIVTMTTKGFWILLCLCCASRPLSTQQSQLSLDQGDGCAGVFVPGWSRTDCLGTDSAQQTPSYRL